MTQDPQAETQKTANVARGEWLSAWVDGPLHAGDTARCEPALAAFQEDPAAREAWATHHWLGDVLREGAMAPQRADPAFVAGVMARVAQEPRPTTRALDTPAANDARWRWAAAVAGLAVVVGVAWQLTAGQGSGAEAQLAAVPVSPPSALEPAVMLRDPQLEAFLAAHRGQGGLTALQQPAGFLLNATYDATPR